MEKWKKDSIIMILICASVAFMLVLLYGVGQDLDIKLKTYWHLLSFFSALDVMFGLYVLIYMFSKIEP